MIYTLFEIATVLFACVLIHIFFNGWFGTRNRKSHFFFLVMAIYFLLHTAVTLLPISPPLRALLSTILIVGIAAILYETTKFSAIYSAFIFMALAVLSEYLCFVAFEAFGFDSDELMSNGNLRAIFLVFAKTVHLIVVIGATSFLRRNRATLTAKQIAPLLPCVFMSIYICVVFFYIYPYDNDNFAVMLIVALVGLLYINGVIILNTQSIKDNVVKIEQQKLASQHFELQKQYYDNVIVDREETRALWHDLNKYITGLESLVKSGDKLSAKAEYLSVRNTFSKLGNVVDTENSNLNAILHHNISRAKANNIAVSLDAKVSSEISISVVDLNIIIGNTFDNAIEECVSLPDDLRKITTTIVQKSNMLFYEIVNPCMPFPQKKSGKVHGYGLKNVQRYVEKHSGSMDFGVADGQYRVAIRLNCPPHRN